jgi:hypothetical protein
MASSPDGVTGTDHVSTFAGRCVVLTASGPHGGGNTLREEVDGMLNLFLILAALTGLPAFTEVGRLVMSILVRLIGLAFVMALVIIVLLALTIFNCGSYRGA